MSVANASPRPCPTPPVISTENSLSSKISSQIDLLISIHIYAWPALTLAISNNWGGPSSVSSDKRDWLCGAVSDLLSSNQVSDAEDLEEVLLQVMVDEFEVVVDDDSAMEVSLKIMKGREKILGGDSTELQALYHAWKAKQANGGKDRVVWKQVEDQDGEEVDWDDVDDVDDDDEESNQDQEMAEAPPLIEKPRREKAEPEIDEDGFTKVTGRKNR